VVRCGPLMWTGDFPDGPVQFSLRPENIHVASESVETPGSLRIRGKVLQQAFHGATELIRVQCGDDLILAVRTPGDIGILNDVELEFCPRDAVLVRKSPERI
jgi:TOBE domain